MALWKMVLTEKLQAGQNCHFYLFTLKTLEHLIEESLYSYAAIPTTNVEEYKTSSDMFTLHSARNWSAVVFIYKSD